MSSPYKTVALHTFGCKANFADTSFLNSSFSEIGYNIVSFNKSQYKLIARLASSFPGIG